MFRYIFDADYKFGGLPQVELKPIEGAVELFGARFEPVTVIHGETPILGFRFGSAAYLTDHSSVPAETLDKLRGLGHSFSRCAASQTPPDAFDRRAIAGDCGRSETKARIFHAYLPRPAA